MRLLKINEIKGEIEVITGLHIGTSSDTIEIGGMDNPIIKDPISGEPYIPGSSLKGKMRSLMEWINGKVLENNGKPCSCGLCDICRVFGVASSGKNEDEEKALKRGPTRLIVRDAFLTSEWRNRYKKGEQIVEEKYENSIDRISAAANPRPIERIVPGVTFNFSLLYQIIDVNNDGGKTDNENFDKIVLNGLRYLQKNYLGGGGSRGNGQIIFKNLKLISINLEKSSKEEKDLTLPEV